jgi:hypothetical protein
MRKRWLAIAAVGWAAGCANGPQGLAGDPSTAADRPSGSVPVLFGVHNRAADRKLLYFGSGIVLEGTGFLGAGDVIRVRQGDASFETRAAAGSTTTLLQSDLPDGLTESVADRIDSIAVETSAGESNQVLFEVFRRGPRINPRGIVNALQWEDPIYADGFISIYGSGFLGNATTVSIHQGNQVVVIGGGDYFYVSELQINAPLRGSTVAATKSGQTDTVTVTDSTGRSNEEPITIQSH